MNKHVNLNPGKMEITCVATSKAVAAAVAKKNEFTYAVTAFDFAAYTTASLLQLFNNITGLGVSRFSTRDAGIKRIEKALLDMEPTHHDVSVVAPAEPAPAPAEPKKGTKAPAEPKAKVPKAPKLPAEPKTPAQRSQAIADSWKRPEVAAKRAERHSVRVGGQEFDSVRQAFVALGLPIGEHIKFRMRLKEAGTLNEYGKHWFILER